MVKIKIDNLSFTYPESKKPALDRINLEIAEGEFLLIVGGSGSGKSTLLRSIAGLYPEFSGGKIQGNISIDACSITEMDRRKVTEKVGILFQEAENQLVMTGVEQELAFGMENMGLDDLLMKRRIMELSSAMQISSCLHSKVSSLSGGQKQKIALAAIMAMQPEIILLDEPTSQLDPAAAEEILNLVRRMNEENGITVVMVEQRLERCSHLADRIVAMDGGRIIHQSNKAGKMACWAVKNDYPFVSPMMRAFAEAGFSKVPDTVKEGRKILRSLVGNNCSLVNPDNKQRTLSAVLPGLLEIRDMYYVYPDGREALQKINLSVSAGEFLVLMGSNGAGKTTLLKCINALLKPAARGKLSFKNKNIRKMSVEELAADIAYMPQDPGDYLFLPSVREELEFTMKNLGLSNEGQVEDIMDRLEITQYADRNPRDLSTGERQRVVLASALLSKPALLLLDEPSRGLDYQLKRELGEILRKLSSEGTAIVMVSHDVEFAAEYAQNIVLMHEGRIVASGNKYQVLGDSSFYSSQLAKLFYKIADNVQTVDEAVAVLKKLVTANKSAV